MEQPEIVNAPTAVFQIYMAGDIEQAKQVCREFCFDVGLCVTVEPLSFIYTGGEETGFRIGLINYPRFPCASDDIFAKTKKLADRLMSRLCQLSYTIVGPDNTTWVSRRPK